MTNLTKILTRRLAFIDLETTGLDLVADRIFLCGVTKLIPGHPEPVRLSWLMNPGKHIPEEVTEITGYDDEMVKDKPPFSHFAGQIEFQLRDCDLGGFNHRKFDIPMLKEHFDREGTKFDLEGRAIIDVGTLWQNLDPRTLEAGVEKFCGRPHKGPHVAINDTDETAAVLDGMIDWFALHGDDVMALAQRSERSEKFVDLAGKIVVGKDGRPTYGFGNKKGVAIEDDVRSSAPGRSFAEWMLDKDFTIDTKRHLQRIIDQVEDQLS